MNNQLRKEIHLTILSLYNRVGEDVHNIIDNEESVSITLSAKLRDAFGGILHILEEDEEGKGS